MKVINMLKPIYDEYSKVLILGTIPSIKSREVGFYYSHPQNRFWKVLSQIYNEEQPNTINEKISFLTKHHIALYDILASCDIKSSSDSSIKNPVPNQLNPIIKNSKINTIFIIGKKAYNLYQKYCYPETKIEGIYLPSTSPANCFKGIEEKLIKEYTKIKEITDN